MPNLVIGDACCITQNGGLAPQGGRGECRTPRPLHRVQAAEGLEDDRGGIPKTMAAIRMDTLRRYGSNEILAATLPDPAAREARMREMAGRSASRRMR